jgi:hypothetical protein
MGTRFIQGIVIMNFESADNRFWQPEDKENR